MQHRPVWPLVAWCVIAEFALVGTLFGLVATSGGPTASKIGTAPVVATLGRVITVDEYPTEPTPDAVPGDTVNVRMSPEGDPRARCADMGGFMYGSLCMNVDF